MYLGIMVLGKLEWREAQRCCLSQAPAQSASLLTAVTAPTCPHLPSLKHRAMIGRQRCSPSMKPLVYHLQLIVMLFYPAYMFYLFLIKIIDKILYKYIFLIYIKIYI